MAWFNRIRIVPNQQTSNPFLKHFSGKYQAEKHIKTTKEVSRIFLYAQSGVQAASFRKHLLEMQKATLNLDIKIESTVENAQFKLV